MSRQEQVYAGPVAIDGDDFYAELWMQGDTAVVFSRPDNSVRLTLHDVNLANTDGGQLVMTGTADPTGDPVTVQARAAEQVLGTYTRVTVNWLDEPAWPEASVTWTQYRVTVNKAGQEPRTYSGASMRAYVKEAIIVMANGDEVGVTLPVKQGCCGGR